VQIANMVEKRNKVSDLGSAITFISRGRNTGGSCFPKDVKAIIKTAKQYGYDLKVLQAVEEVNECSKNLCFLKS